MQSIADIRSRVNRSRPLIHCITNPISINQCANAVLAVGARPIMAEHPREVREITQTADALMLNLGNITDTRMESMEISVQTARERRIPVLLDAVGAACSRLRRDYAQDLISSAMPTVIKGNYSEIHALYRETYRFSGVDADEALDCAALDRTAAELARRWDTVILASGKTDIITDGRRLIHIHNGTPQLSRVTGTGCMLGALGAAYLSAVAPMDAMITACAVLGICGELAETNRGTGTFLTGLMDGLSTLADTDINNHLNLEAIPIETL